MTDQFRPFKPGDDVYVYPAELDGRPAWAIQHAPKKAEVEPEWVVGQQVSGDDYERLPVGTVAGDGEDGSGYPITKVDAGHWHYLHQPDATAFPNSDWSHIRTLTHLPDATEPEDKADLYVEPVTAPSVDNSEGATEPEPLKEGDWCLVWARVTSHPQEVGQRVSIARPDGYAEHPLYARPEAIRRAGELTPPWVKPARCTSLIECDEGAGVFYLRCCRSPHEGDDQHRLSEPGNVDLSWTDSDEGVVRIKGGAS